MYRQFNIWFSSSAIVVGVATFCKASATPVEAEEGLYKELNPKLDGKVGHYGDVSEFSSDELEALDAEGRAVITKHKIRWKKGHHSSHESFDYSTEVPVLLIDVISRFIKHMCKQLIFFFILKMPFVFRIRF